jgi:hypothetical protein
MPSKRVNLISPVPPPGEDDARREWAIKYRSSFTARWGAQGGFVNKAIPVRWVVPNQDLYQQQPETTSRARVVKKYTKPLITRLQVLEAAIVVLTRASL